MTAAEYDAFIAKPLASREWLAGKGGWKNNNVRYAVAVTAPERETIYVDPSGSDYGRYVGRRVDGAGVVKFPDIRVRLTGKDGNAFNIIGLCKRAAQKGGLSDGGGQSLPRRSHGGRLQPSAGNVPTMVRLLLSSD
jgi:hypothetical protein